MKNVCKYLSTTAAAELKEKQAKAFLAALEAKRAAVVTEGYVMDGDMGSWELMGPEKLQVHICRLSFLSLLLLQDPLFTLADHLLLLFSR